MPWQPSTSPSGSPSGGKPVDRKVIIALAVVFGVVYLAYSQGSVTSDDLLFYAVLVPSIVLHEISHGVVAFWFGDDTAKRAGRLTLNPLRHIDLFGTLILPALLIITTHRSFGYAKPVPVNPNRLRSPRNQGLLVSLAGPATNIVIAVLAALGIRALVTAKSSTGLQTLLVLGEANVMLAVFNLIPLPPLDGSAIIDRFLPRQYLNSWYRFRQYSMLVLAAICWIWGSRFLPYLFDPAIRLWVRLLPVS